MVVTSYLNVRTRLSGTLSLSFKAGTIRLYPGEDLKVKLAEYATSNRIKAACLITCVASLNRWLSVLRTSQALIQLRISLKLSRLPERWQRQGYTSMYVVNDSTGKTIAGHLMEGSLIYTTAEVVAAILEGVAYEREIDSTYGYKNWSFENYSGI